MEGRFESRRRGHEDGLRRALRIRIRNMTAAEAKVAIEDEVLRLEQRGDGDRLAAMVQTLKAKIGGAK